MDVFETIRTRHSYRGPYDSAVVPREDLRSIVEAGLAAPSGCNAQSTMFVIADDPETVAEITRILDKPYLSDVPAYIACVTDPSPVYNGLEFSVEDCAAAVQTMLLAITALGYASVWLDGYLRAEGRADALARLLHVPPEKSVRVVLPVGKPLEQHEPREKKPFEERACWNGFAT